MRFAIATMDRYLGVFEAFVRAGWTPLKLFAMPVANRVDNHQACCALAEQHKAAIQLSPITEHDFAELRDAGCDILVSACHRWHIGDWGPYLKYAVNFHASPLPEGRGVYPLHCAILERRSSWAVTCHRLSHDIDQGDILAAESFALQTDECHESLDLKIQMAAKRLAGRIAGSFAEFWDAAMPQTPLQAWPKNSLKDRVIDFREPTDSIVRQIRAFGATETFAQVNNSWLSVRRAMGWVERHGQAPGTVAHVHNNMIVIAASDGYIVLSEMEMAGPEILAELSKIHAPASP